MFTYGSLRCYIPFRIRNRRKRTFFLHLSRYLGPYSSLWIVYKKCVDWIYRILYILKNCVGLVYKIIYIFLKNCRRWIDNSVNSLKNYGHWMYRNQDCVHLKKKKFVYVQCIKLCTFLKIVYFKYTKFRIFFEKLCMLYVEYT